MSIDKETGEILDFYHNHGMLPQLRTMRNYNRDVISQKTGLVCRDESRTQQQFKEETDIRLIMERYGVTGVAPQYVRAVMPEDYDNITDFASAMNTIREASEAFNAMPSGIRARFQNNPQVFMEFFAQEENRAEAERMGLVIPRRQPDPQVEPGTGG